MDLKPTLQPVTYVSKQFYVETPSWRSPLMVLITSCSLDEQTFFASAWSCWISLTLFRSSFVAYDCFKASISPACSFMVSLADTAISTTVYSSLPCRCDVTNPAQLVKQYCQTLDRSPLKRWTRIRTGPIVAHRTDDGHSLNPNM